MLNFSEINEMTIQYVGKLSEKRIQRGTASFADYVMAGFAKADPEMRKKLTAILAEEVEREGL